METNFSQMFQDKVGVQTIFGSASVQIVDIGEIYLPTGKLVSYDPLDALDTVTGELPSPFSVDILPGIYSVQLSIASSAKDKSYYTLGARILINQKPAV